MAILSDGNFKRIQSEEEWHRVKNEVELIWDIGEILIGWQILENNKPGPFCLQQRFISE